MQLPCFSLDLKIKSVLVDPFINRRLPKGLKVHYIKDKFGVGRCMNTLIVVCNSSED